MLLCLYTLLEPCVKILVMEGGNEKMEMDAF